jgi:uncharacterized membrane protein
MKKGADEDKKIWATAFHSCLIWEINRLEQDEGDPAMWDYQISLLEKADSNKFAKKIRELKRTREKVAKKWVRNQKKIKIMEEELALYEKCLEGFEN